MPSAPLNPPVGDKVPLSVNLAEYDRRHFVTYLRLIDASAAGADWTEVARLVLHIASCEPERARCAWESHMAGAEWMRQRGYGHLLWPRTDVH